MRTSKILLLGVMLLISAVAFGQAISGDLVGTVTDKSGAVVANATVDAVNQATNLKTSTTTNAAGEYRFSNLPVGTYDITASAKGFGGKTLKGFRVELNKTATLNLAMEVGQVATTVEVTDIAPTIDTTTAQLATTYDSKLAADLPNTNQGSGVLNLSLLQAGVGSTGAIGAGSGPSVGGQRPRNNNFTVEGVDINDKTVTGPLISLPGDSVENVTVMTNQFSPEFGHSTGGQFNQIIKSGSNSFHGKAYEYLQNRNLNAVDYANSNQGIKKNPRFDDNRFGGSIGGPVIKNKLFFFFNGEYEPIGQSAVPSSPALTPTSAGVAKLGTIAGVSSTNLGVFKQFVPVAPTACPKVTPAPKAAAPCPDGGTVAVNGQAVEVGILPITAPNFTNKKRYLGSADWNISGSDTLRGRYAYYSNVGIDTAAELPVFFTPSPYKAHVATLSEYHNFSPMINNEFRVGFSRFSNIADAGNFSFPGLDSFPNLTFADLQLQVGPDDNAPQFTIQNLYQLTDNLSWNKGRHSWKFGVEVHHYISPQSFTQRQRGDYNYNTLDFYMRDQAPENLAERSGGNTTYYGDQNAFYWFVNDVWKVRPNVSLNFGLRHEYTTRPVGERRQTLNKISDVPGLITFDEPQAPKTNFAPRVGLAWSPGSSGTTSVRAGFGMGYDVLFDNIGILEQPPQIGSTIDCAQSDYPSSQCPPINGFLKGGGISGGGSGITAIPGGAAGARAATASWIPPNVKYPYSMQWNLGIQHVFAKDYTAEVRYVGTRGVHLDVQDRINRQSKTSPTFFLPTLLAAPTQAQLNSMTTTLSAINAKSSFVPAYASAGFNANSIVAFIPAGGSSYHGLSGQLTRRFTSGLYFLGAYTWSHTIDDSTADFFSTVLTPRRPQDFQNLAADRSNSALDRAHRFTLTLVYDVPFFRNANWLVKNLAGNWQIAPVYTYETGEWADVQSAQDVNRNGDSAGDRAIFNPAGVKNTSSDVTALKRTDGQTVAYLANNPNAQYIRAGLGALANSSRNTLQQPPINNFDVSLLKRFAFTERFKFEFGAQMLNAFNHPQFVPGSLNDIASIGRRSDPVKFSLVPGNVTFNRPDKVFPSNARTVQLSGKFIF